VKKDLEELEKELGYSIASTPFDLIVDDPEEVDESGMPDFIIRNKETNLGDLIADAFLSVSGADVAVFNGGGIRTEIAEGDITYGELINVMPFENKMVVLEVTGQQILDALEWGAKAVPDESGGFLHVAGMTYEIHADIESSCKEDENGMFAGVEGEYRVQNVMIGSEALDPEKTYSLSSNDYTLMYLGDGFAMFDGCKVLQEGPQIDVQVVIAYLTETLGGVVSDEYKNPYGQGRIKIILPA
jgi:2',3'-cyclic-nucleotide 2'-phosphodiesterase (5'-nucleotidase family)